VTGFQHAAIVSLLVPLLLREELLSHSVLSREIEADVMVWGDLLEANVHQ
jgi:hypothetical protein